MPEKNLTEIKESIERECEKVCPTVPMPEREEVQILSRVEFPCDRCQSRDMNAIIARINAIGGIWCDGGETVTHLEIVVPEKYGDEMLYRLFDLEGELQREFPDERFQFTTRWVP